MLLLIGDWKVDLQLQLDDEQHLVLIERWMDELLNKMEKKIGQEAVA